MVVWPLLVTVECGIDYAFLNILSLFLSNALLFRDSQGIISVWTTEGGSSLHGPSPDSLLQLPLAVTFAFYSF